MARREAEPAGVVAESARWQEQDRLDAARIAVRYYLARYPHYRRAEIREQIAKERPDLVLKHDVQLTRLLKFAWERGLVRVSPWEITKAGSSAASRDEPLGHQLALAFGLQWAVVLDVPYSRKYGYAEDDDLHRVLAQAAARDLRMIAADGMHIGIGGGRAPYFLAAAVAEQSAGWPRGIKASSLTGNMFTRAWDEKEPYSVDADSATTLLGNALRDAEARCLGLPAVLRPGDRARYLENRARAISQKLWEEASANGNADVIPEVAVVGIGSLGPGAHRLLKDDFVLDPIERHLQALRKLLPHTPRGTCVAFDICNFMLPARDMPLDHEQHLGEADRSELEAAIAGINGQMLSVTADQLRLVKKVIAVAGVNRLRLAIDSAASGLIVMLFRVAAWLTIVASSSMVYGFI